MNQSKILLFIVGTCVTLLALPSLAKDKPGKTIKSPKAAADSPPAVAWSGEMPNTRSTTPEPWVKVGVQFSEQERATIRQYTGAYKGKGKGHGKTRELPPGLAKKLARGEDLPPGWQKKIEVGQTMPPEVYQHCHPLPPDLAVKLPPPPEPTITVAVGGKVVRLLQATREILDVFDVHMTL